MDGQRKPDRTSWDFEKAARMLAAGDARGAAQILDREQAPGTAIEKDRLDVPPAEERGTDVEALPVPPALLPRYMDEEKWRDMERAAAKGLMPEPEIKAGRRMLYFALLGLYAGQRSGAIPLGVARAEKRMAVECYNRFAADSALYQQNGEFYKQIEAACTAFAKKPDYKNAKAMYSAVYGCVANIRMKMQEAYDDETEAGKEGASC